jgi:hypothetical protein
MLVRFIMLLPPQPAAARASPLAEIVRSYGGVLYHGFRIHESRGGHGDLEAEE